MNIFIIFILFYYYYLLASFEKEKNNKFSPPSITVFPMKNVILYF